MRPGGYYRTYRYSVVPPTGRIVGRLLIINLGVFFFHKVLIGSAGWFTYLLGLAPSAFLGKGFIWQIVTYMFLHGGAWHILLNMLFLWMMGSELERHWGSREFLKYYLITGVGAGLVNLLVQAMLDVSAGRPLSDTTTIGASGAVFGLIIAFAMAFPDREILLYFFIRIKAKYFAVLVGVLEVVSLIHMPDAPIARYAHLGGLAIGYLYLKQERLGYSVRRRIGAWQAGVHRAAQRREYERRAAIKKEVDRILDKISKEGIESLTDRERRFLREQGGGREI